MGAWVVGAPAALALVAVAAGAARVRARRLRRAAEDAAPTPRERALREARRALNSARRDTEKQRRSPFPADGQNPADDPAVGYGYHGNDGGGGHGGG